MPRDRNDIIYQLTVEDIFNAADWNGIDDAELTDAVIEKVCHKIAVMDFVDMSETIAKFIEEAIKEYK